MKNYSLTSKQFLYSLTALPLAFAAANVQALTLSVAGAAGYTGVAVESSDSGQSTDLASNRSPGFGLGVLVETPATPLIGIGTGAIYMKRRFDIGNSTAGIQRVAPSVFVPLEARIWIANMFAVSLGGFASMTVGDVSDTYTLGDATIGTFSSEQRNSIEYGLTAAFDVNFATVNKTGLFAQARYNYGISNAANDGSFNEKIRDFWVLAGVRLSL